MKFPLFSVWGYLVLHPYHWIFNSVAVSMHETEKSLARDFIRAESVHRFFYFTSEICQCFGNAEAKNVHTKRSNQISNEMLNSIERYRMLKGSQRLSCESVFFVRNLKIGQIQCIFIAIILSVVVVGCFTISQTPSALCWSSSRLSEFAFMFWCVNECIYVCMCM